VVPRAGQRRCPSGGRPVPAGPRVPARPGVPVGRALAWPAPRGPLHSRSLRPVGRSSEPGHRVPPEPSWFIRFWAPKHPGTPAGTGWPCESIPASGSVHLDENSRAAAALMIPVRYPCSTPLGPPRCSPDADPVSHPVGQRREQQDADPAGQVVAFSESVELSRRCRSREQYARRDVMPSRRARCAPGPSAAAAGCAALVLGEPAFDRRVRRASPGSAARTADWAQNAGGISEYWRDVDSHGGKMRSMPSVTARTSRLRAGRVCAGCRPSSRSGDLEDAGHDGHHTDGDGEERGRPWPEGRPGCGRRPFLSVRPPGRERGCAIMVRQTSPTCTAISPQQDAGQQQHVHDVEPGIQLVPGTRSRKIKVVEPRCRPPGMDITKPDMIRRPVRREVVRQRVPGEALHEAHQISRMPMIQFAPGLAERPVTTSGTCHESRRRDSSAAQWCTCGRTARHARRRRICRALSRPGTWTGRAGVEHAVVGDLLHRRVRRTGPGTCGEQQTMKLYNAISPSMNDQCVGRPC